MDTLHLSALPCLALVSCCLALLVLVKVVVVLVLQGGDGRGCKLLSSGQYTLVDLDIQTLLPVQSFHVCVIWGRFKF